VVHNNGIISTGPNAMNFKDVVIGDGATFTQSAAPPPSPGDGPRRPGRWRVGVITVLAVEMRAVLDLLRPTHEEIFDGRRFHEARVRVDDDTVGVVVTQALGPGQRQAAAAYQHLRARYAPPVIVLVGIAGGIHPDVRPGDVVAGNRIVYYESRREDPGETRFRGESHDVPPATGHSLNAFFTRHGEPAELRRPEGRRTVSFRVRLGPIGSGEAVIRDEDNAARRWLRQFNDKVLATETEGAGLAHGFHEDRDASSPPRGWLVIRGISDLANPAKDDSHHTLASRNAAHTFSALLPYLVSSAVSRR
jgi:adenosylhomocysteine nucleosidase